MIVMTYKKFVGPVVGARDVGSPFFAGPVKRGSGNCTICGQKGHNAAKHKDMNCIDCGHSLARHGPPYGVGPEQEGCATCGCGSIGG